jgi:hypothetical protein
MILKDCDNLFLVPLDFVSNKEKNILKIKKNNKTIVKDLTNYILNPRG